MAGSLSATLRSMLLEPLLLRPAYCGEPSGEVVPGDASVTEKKGEKMMMKKKNGLTAAFVSWSVDSQSVVVDALLGNELWQLVLTEQLLEATRKDAGGTSDHMFCTDVVSSLRLAHEDARNSSRRHGAARIYEDMRGTNLRNERAVAMVIVFDFDDPENSFESKPFEFKRTVEYMSNISRDLLMRLWVNFSASREMHTRNAHGSLVTDSSQAADSKSVVVSPRAASSSSSSSTSSTSSTSTSLLLKRLKSEPVRSSASLACSRANGDEQGCYSNEAERGQKRKGTLQRAVSLRVTAKERTSAYVKLRASPGKAKIRKIERDRPLARN